MCAQNERLTRARGRTPHRFFLLYNYEMKTIFTALLVLVAAGSYFYVHFKSAEAPDATVSPKVTDVKETDGSISRLTP